MLGFEMGDAAIEHLADRPGRFDLLLTSSVKQVDPRDPKTLDNRTGGVPIEQHGNRIAFEFVCISTSFRRG